MTLWHDTNEQLRGLGVKAVELCFPKSFEPDGRHTGFALHLENDGGILPRLLR
jgi:hypothetical protein